MATTGFWPVRGRMKEVLDYADNPDKTTDRKYLDDDLYDALRYTENDDKTDEKKYISGINCLAAFAYREMTAVKRKYGERGKVIAYHGYQSFKADELTPEECHAIGIETARRMWGKDYQVLVTTHFNTDIINAFATEQFGADFINSFLHRYILCVFFFALYHLLSKLLRMSNFKMRHSSRRSASVKRPCLNSASTIAYCTRSAIHSFGNCSTG